MFTETITVEKVNEVYMRVVAEGGVRQELYDFFSFYAPNYQFSPKFKAKVWDGKIRLYSSMKPLLYIGLLDQLKEFAELREYELDIDPQLIPTGGVTEEDILDLCQEIGLTYTPRDYQIDYVLNALNNNRSLSISPTSSGKSLIINVIEEYYRRTFDCRVLIVVPTVSLVLQMQSDFIDYGTDPELIHVIKGGAEKTTNKPIVISTWQSLQNIPREWFLQFRVILGDEAHLFAAKSLVTIMEHLSEAEFRHGFSGTIPKDSKVNQLVLTGLFGAQKQFITTKDLIDNDTVADFKIRALVLQYPEETKKTFRTAVKKIDKTLRYQAEKEFLASHNRRNKFIVNLVKSLEGKNNLILFERVEKHGKVLKPLLEIEGRKLHFIYGAVSGEDRERMRKEIEEDPVKNHNILASYQTLSTGFSLKRLDNIIFASGSKSEVRVLQSVGRVLRKGNGSDDATLYDLVDDLSQGSYTNYTLQHFEQRAQFYTEQEFDLKIYNVDLPDKI